MLEHLFGSTTRVKLLQIFFRSPERAFFVRELSRLTGNQLNAVRRELANLVALGIVEPAVGKPANALEPGTERSKFYALDADSLLFSELQALLLKAELLEEQVLIKNVKERAGTIKLLMLTGIFTNETEVGTDMLLVGEIKPVVLGKIIAEYEHHIGRSVRYTILNEEEFGDRRKIGDKFLYSILEAKHITPVDTFRLH